VVRRFKLPVFYTVVLCFSAVFSGLVGAALLLGGCVEREIAISRRVTEQPSATGDQRSATVTVSPLPTLTHSPSPTSSPLPPSPSPTLTSSPTLYPPSPTPSPTPAPLVPNFPHIFLIILENKEFGTVIGPQRGMPNLNLWASEYTLLTQYYAIRHPSLPNYLALIGGDTFGVDTNCQSCYQNALTLPELIEASGRTWKGYFEDMPEPCYAGNTNLYAQKHNPFMYFDSIRLNAERCQRSVVPLTQLNADLAANDLPDFALIIPNLCNDAHDCSVDIADTWLDHWVPPLVHTQAYDEGALIAITFEEGQGEHTCCGLTTGGGRVAMILISNWVKRGYEDDTPYTHYSLLKTISQAWGLPYLGHAADESNVLIVKPWER
jgi:phospholipase C